MSEEKVLCSHELVIRFDQHEGNRITWYVTPDQKVWDTRDCSMIELVDCNAPLAALGIRALWKLCMDGLVYHSLEQASSILKGLANRPVPDTLEAPLELTPEGVTIN